MNNCTEWQEVFKTAAKAALLIVILDALRVTRNSDWFEEQCVPAVDSAARMGANMSCAPRRRRADALSIPTRSVDFVSMQAVLFNGAARGWWAQTQALVRMQARLTEDE